MILGLHHISITTPDLDRLTAFYTHFCMAVSDIEQEYARLVAAGVRFQCPPLKFDGVGWATHGRDPDGNIFELIESEPSAQRAGTDHGD